MIKIILKETIPSLGIIGSEVTVADGYARNYLLPQGKAVKDTPQNRNQLKQEKAKIEVQIVKERASAEEMAKKLEGISCTIPAKVSDENRLYGSVSSRDIVDALAKKNIAIEKRMILLDGPIKTTGAFHIPIRIYKDVEPEIVVEIVPE